MRRRDELGAAPRDDCRERCGRRLTRVEGAERDADLGARGSRHERELGGRPVAELVSPRPGTRRAARSGVRDLCQLAVLAVVLAALSPELATAQDPLATSLAIARVEASSHRYREAAAIMRDVVAQRPDDPELWAGLGLACLGARDVAGAVEAYARAATLRPGEVVYRVALARALAAADRAETARDEYAAALTIAPGDGDARVGMALLRSRGDPAWTIGLSRAQRDALAVELRAIESDRDGSTLFFVFGGFAVVGGIGSLFAVLISDLSAAFDASRMGPRDRSGFEAGVAGSLVVAIGGLVLIGAGAGVLSASRARHRRWRDGIERHPARLFVRLSLDGAGLSISGEL